jgi:hypothetical protein
MRKWISWEVKKRTIKVVTQEEHPKEEEDQIERDELQNREEEEKGRGEGEQKIDIKVEGEFEKSEEMAKDDRWKG